MGKQIMVSELAYLFLLILVIAVVFVPVIAKVCHMVTVSYAVNPILKLLIQVLVLVPSSENVSL